MSLLLCQMLLLVFLSSRAAVLVVDGLNNAIICGYDVNCQAIVKLMSTVNEINDKLDKSASQPDVSEKLEKLDTSVHAIHSKQVKDSEKLDKLATSVHDVHSKQAKDVELLTASMNRSLASTAAISTELKRHSSDLLKHDERLKTHDLLLANMYQLVQSIYWADLGPQDCTDIRTMGFSVSGVYRVYTRRIATDVYCDLSVPTESWLVFQRRRDGSQNFDRTWSEYARGFGNLNWEFWLGNEKLALLTMNKKYKARFVLEDFTGGKRWAEYSMFSVKPASDKYRVTVGGYSGNAGDSFRPHHNNMMFSTKDADNDANSGGHCAQWVNAGWWYNNCVTSNLNGLYLRGSHSRSYHGIYWKDWKGPLYSLKASEMKITAVK